MTMPWKRLPNVFHIDVTRMRDRRFWVVQLLVFALAAAHALVEALGTLPHGASLYFVPETLFLIPVGYAALNFGLHGAVATSLWCTVLAVPNLVIFHHGDQFAAAVTQLLIVNAVAIFVGYRVEQEVLARRRADAALNALQASERRYRGLFHNSAAAVMVFGRDGRVREANSAAAQMFGVNDVQGEDLSGLVGERAARQLLDTPSGSSAGRVSPAFTLVRSSGAEVRVEPTSTAFTGPKGQKWIQTSLHDVTKQQLRQAQLRTYAGRILQAQEEERRRIAQELHDETIQRIVVLSRYLHQAEEAVTPDPPGVGPQVRSAIETAEDLMVSLREFTRQLRPPALDELGVATCLRRMVSDLSLQTGMAASVTVEGREQRLGSDLELSVFRIAQESLRNVERHAQASNVWVRLSYTPSLVQLTVEDDGQGFSDGAADLQSSTGGLGLLGMQERAALLGGELEIETSPDSGTRLEARIPR